MLKITEIVNRAKFFSSLLNSCGVIGICSSGYCTQKYNTKSKINY